ncbi:MAG: hypothetical protein ACTTGJ_00680 [Clostridium sp.]
MKKDKNQNLVGIHVLMEEFSEENEESHKYKLLYLADDTTSIKISYNYNDNVIFTLLEPNEVEKEIPAIKEKVLYLRNINYSTAQIVQIINDIYKYKANVKSEE